MDHKALNHSLLPLLQLQFGIWFSKRIGKTHNLVKLSMQKMRKYEEWEREEWKRKKWPKRNIWSIIIIIPFLHPSDDTFCFFFSCYSTSWKKRWFLFNTLNDLYMWPDKSLYFCSQAFFFPWLILSSKRQKGLLLKQLLLLLLLLITIIIININNSNIITDFIFYHFSSSLYFFIFFFTGALLLSYQGW